MAQCGDADRLLLAISRDTINTCDVEGNSLAMIALAHGHVALGNALIACGADVLSKNSQGLSALDLLDDIEEKRARARAIQDIRFRTETDCLARSFEQIASNAGTRLEAQAI